MHNFAPSSASLQYRPFAPHSDQAKVLDRPSYVADSSGTKQPLSLDCCTLVMFCTTYETPQCRSCSLVWAVWGHQSPNQCIFCVGVLQEAVARREYWRLVDNLGRPPGMMGMWPSRAVTFIENHDTGADPCSGADSLGEASKGACAGG